MHMSIELHCTYGENTFLIFFFVGNLVVVYMYMYTAYVYISTYYILLDFFLYSPHLSVLDPEAEQNHMQS